MATPAEPAFGESRVYDNNDAMERLAQMGLRPEYFEAAIRHGHERNQNWAGGQTSNYETSYHPERGVAIAVVGGDNNTGVHGLEPPKTARKRGPVTAKRISRNVHGQAPFDLPEFADPPQADELCDTWFFMLKARNDVMYCELSMPTSLGADSRVSRWAERIILPPTSLTGIAITPIENDGTDEAPAVHVDRK